MHSEDGNAPGPTAFEEIRNLGQIVLWLTKAAKEEEKVEVVVDDHSRVYFAYFMDMLPDVPESPLPTPTDPPVAADAAAVIPLDGKILKVKSAPTHVVHAPVSGESFAYIKERQNLLIAPLIPAIGNARIRTSQEVILRFFQGVKAIEAPVTFISTKEIQGEPAILLTFPKYCRVFRKRRHYRAKSTPEVVLTLTIQRQDAVPIQVNLIDISVGGLACCFSEVEEGLQVGDVLRVEIRLPEMEPIRVIAYVRNLGRATTKEGCRKGEGRCGVQFDVINEALALQISEVVSYVQRGYLQSLQEKRSDAAPSRASEAAAGKGRGGHSGGVGEEINKLLNLKKLFHIR